MASDDTRKLEAVRQRLVLQIETETLKYKLKQAKRLNAGARHFEAADMGPRSRKIRAPGASGPNSVLRPAMRTLRERCRDMVRNNPYAESAMSVIVSGTIGTGITPAIKENKRLARLWTSWAESTQCDAAGLSNMAGLQTVAMQSWVETGEVLFRRVVRKDWKPGEIPYAIQLLEPDYLDDSQYFGSDYRMGIKTDEYGRPLAYRVFKAHPHDSEVYGLSGVTTESTEVSAADMGLLYWRKRAGQLRGIPPLTPVLLRLRGLDENDDAETMRRKVAACFAMFVQNIEGEREMEREDPMLSDVTPGMVAYLKHGEEIRFAVPPAAGGYNDYMTLGYRGIAAGLGLPYEDLTGDYSNVNWSSGRLARIKYYGNLDVWQWQMVIPMFCQKTFGWFLDGAEMLGVPHKSAMVNWTVPRRPVADPNEYAKIRDEVRSGMKSLPESIRENGYDPDDVLEQNKEYFAKLDAAGLIVDSDPRKVSSIGQTQPDLINHNNADNN
jgi:phage portal protein, lambda family